MKIVIAENNSVRLVKRQYNAQPTGSTFTEIEAPFDRNYFNTLYYDEIKYNNDYRLQMFAQQNGDYANYLLQELRGQSLKIQIKSDTALTLNTNIKVSVKDGLGVDTTFTASLAKKIDNRTHKIEYETVNILSSSGYLAFYFGTSVTNTYGVNTIIETETTYLNGDIPQYLDTGQQFAIYLGIGNPNNVNFGDGNIIAGLGYNTTLNKYVLVTDKPYTPVSETTASLVTQHQRSEFDIYELTLSGFVGVGCKKIAITTSTDSWTSILELWESEMLYFNVDINGGLLLFQWYNARDKFGVDFRTGLQNYAYLYCDMYELQPDLKTVIATNETGGGKLLDSSYKRKFKLQFTGMARHLCEKIAIIFAHEYVFINGKQFAIVDGSYKVSGIEKSMMYDCECEVTETELLGIYSDGYVNTSPTPEGIGDGNLLQIDDEGHVLDIGGGYGLDIDADELPT